MNVETYVKELLVPSLPESLNGNDIAFIIAATLGVYFKDEKEVVKLVLISALVKWGAFSRGINVEEKQ